MKTTTQIIVLLFFGLLTNNTVLYADRMDLWNNATTAEKIIMLKERVATELDKLHIAHQDQQLFELDAPSTMNWFALMEGKGLFQGELYNQTASIVPFMKELSAGNHLLLHALATCLNTSKAIASLINLYKISKKHDAREDLDELEQQHRIKKALKDQVLSLDNDLAKLQADNARLRRKFYLYANKKAARDFLVFLNERLQTAIANIKISFNALQETVAFEEGAYKEEEITGE